MVALAVPQGIPTVIIFDEISWMAEHDLDFAGKLKIAWDTLFAVHNQLIVILCGSVSAWIQKIRQDLRSPPVNAVAVNAVSARSTMAIVHRETQISR